MLPRKYDSGSQKRNKRKRIDEMIKTQKGALDKFFKTGSSLAQSSDTNNEKEIYNDIVNEHIDFKEIDNDNMNEEIDNIVDKELASKLEIEPIFSQKRKTYRKKQFDENSPENISLSPEESFRINYFNVIVDVAISSLKSRFEQLEVFENIFGFMFYPKKLTSLDDEGLRESCITLQTALAHNDKYDVDASDLFSEFQVLQTCLPAEANSVIDVLEFVRTMDCFPNISIAYRILLTIPVTVASAERSFSKLKLIKTYLRSTMSQERLNGLGILCIENETLEKLDFEDLIDEFASKNARRTKIFQ